MRTAVRATELKVVDLHLAHSVKDFLCGCTLEGARRAEVLRNPQCSWTNGNVDRLDGIVLQIRKGLNVKLGGPALRHRYLPAYLNRPIRRSHLQIRTPSCLSVHAPAVHGPLPEQHLRPTVARDLRGGDV